MDVTSELETTTVANLKCNSKSTEATNSNTQVEKVKTAYQVPSASVAGDRSEILTIAELP